MDSQNYLAIQQLIGAKDPKGLKLLYERYGKPFYIYALKRWELAEDEAWEVVYKTLETLVLKLPAYDFSSQVMFDGFLYKVFINFLRQNYRKDRAKQLPEIEFFDLEQENQLPGDIQEALTKQAFLDYYLSETYDNPRMKALKTSLEYLEQKDRDILLLRAQNYSYDEIAAMLGIENKQLKVTHLRAKQKLISLINEMKI